MRYKNLALILPLMMLTVALAADSDTIDATDKAALDAGKGKTVSVEGKVSKAEWSKSGKVLNVEFENADHFVVAAFSQNRAKLDEAFSGDFAKAITGAKIKLTGKLGDYGGKAKDYEGRLQLVINAANQVTIVEAAPSTQPTTQP